jgi:hypothetical protein
MLDRTSALDGERIAGPARSRLHRLRTDPLDMAGRIAAASSTWPGAQRGKDSAMIVIGARLPVRAPGREQEAGAGGMKIVDRRQQTRHGTGRHDQPMEAPIRLLPGTDIRRIVAGPGRLLGLVENGARQMRAGMA